MDSGKRPGGLTALAVINFIFGGFGVLGALGSIALIPLLGRIPEQATANMRDEQLEQFRALQDIGPTLFVTLGALALVSAVLLIASGFGYLKLKKTLGRTLGNTYGVLGILSALGRTLWLPAALGGSGFNIATIIGLIYPALTLILLNTAFKEDFVN